MSSRIPGFYKLHPDERLRALEAFGVVTDDLSPWRSGLSLEAADLMVENVVSTFSLPCGVAVNFLIDGRERVVPMVVEEPSVVAAVSNVARLVRKDGGFRTSSDPSHMIGQVQLMAVRDPADTVARLQEALPRLREEARGVHPRLEERGGGLVSFEVRHVAYDEPGHVREDMVVLQFVLDVADAMGANMVNTLAERLAPTVAEVTGEQVGLRILSNLADRRLSRARVTVSPASLQTEDLDGMEVAERIAAAWRFAWADPYRAATHNKGVMNGIDAVAVATGNDWRAIESGAHAFAARDGHYRPLTRFELVDGKLEGSIEVPLQIGTVGGPIRVHPTVKANLGLLGVTGARELSGIVAAVGLAQNLGALKALATDGIQAGHMRMHARTVAATAGAEPHEVAAVTRELCRKHDFSVEHAAEVLRRLRAAG
ncbi:MAG: hydroxymethylglutaryl-CoA reductase, degradative [Alphaproteobacteria bacterium]|nr:hydroxymethylglutaryl-CoA reductase, degradative [Alphaproteobacteria bacterium]MCB9698519.1 hydroxymethylglutaryl-CoA reductase, degradative [Alphaproteobacteria bacterium]